MEEPILTNEEFIALLEESAQESITEFNALYGTNRTIDDDTMDYLLAFAVVSLFGYNALFARTDIAQPIKNDVLRQFDKEYKGINATTQRELENLAKKLTEEELENQMDGFRARRTKEITDGVYFTTKNELQSVMAEDEGLVFVGAITVGDERVRKSHRPNDGKYWRASRYQPWRDYGCRCVYSWFRTAKEAREAGFTAL
jgi:hypothetical protein